jgi:hypothetical protein
MYFVGPHPSCLQLIGESIIPIIVQKYFIPRYDADAEFCLLIILMFALGLYLGSLFQSQTTAFVKSIHNFDTRFSPTSVLSSHPVLRRVVGTPCSTHWIGVIPYVKKYGVYPMVFFMVQLYANTADGNFSSQSL